MTPDCAATLVSFMAGDDPDVLRLMIAENEADQRRLFYRLFTSRWRKEADRRLLARLKAKLEDHV